MLRVDLHIHSLYYPGALKECTLEGLAKFAKLKGLNVLGTGDALHPKWRENLKQKLKRLEGIYEFDGIYFIPSVEVKLNTYVHSVIVLPTLEHFDDLYNVLRNYGKLDKVGAPFVYISGEEIQKIVEELGGFLFVAHPFIPFQSVYVKYKNFNEYFGKDKTFCVEVTPSVDNPMASKVKDICNKTFLSNSDNHTLMHLGRNFNLMDAEPNFDSILNAIKKNKVVNYEMPAPLGKYYLTRCKCGEFYRFEDAKRLNFKCEVCGKKIWIGTKDRIEYSIEKVRKCEKEHPFVYNVPLRKILEDILGIKNARNKIIKIIQRYPEIDLLHFLDLKEVKISERVKKAIEIVREGKYFIFPGGGWKDGKIVLEEPKVEFHKVKLSGLEEFLL